jgi:1-aminocyclopropane-1-carboxylate deaminase
MDQPTINEIRLENIICEEIVTQETQSKGIQWQLLRLDRIHPVISGNKWFKLKYYLQDACSRGFKGIVTFGGAYSNHIIAAAYAARLAGLSSVGIIRGEEPSEWSHTLIEAGNYGMELHFVSREAFAQKKDADIANNFPGCLVIPEGGYGEAGAKGAAEILQYVNSSSFDYTCCACGTGTMLAGLIRAADEQLNCIGISVLKGQTDLIEKVTDLLSTEKRNRQFSIIHDFHFGGYAKKNNELTEFMNNFYLQHNIPTDFVYTGKLMFAVDSLIRNNFFPGGSRILAIHSGGLQGNRSLPPGTLVF